MLLPWQSLIAHWQLVRQADVVVIAGIVQRVPVHKHHVHVAAIFCGGGDGWVPGGPIWVGWVRVGGWVRWQASWVPGGLVIRCCSVGYVEADAGHMHCGGTSANRQQAMARLQHQARPLASH